MDSTTQQHHVQNFHTPEGSTSQIGRTTERHDVPSFEPSSNRRVGTFDTMQSSSSYEDCWRSQFVLSLDGGGVRGYSSLLILKELMTIIENIERKHAEPANSSLYPHSLPSSSRSSTDGDGPKETPSSAFYPCHYFDYMFGTSTGGLIAIMLSRLRMNVDEALEEYRKLAGSVFSNPRLASIRGPIPWPIGKYRSDRLEKAVRGVIHSQTIKKSANRQQQMEESPGDETFNSEPAMCRTVCVAWVNIADRNAVEEPFLFRSYEHVAGGYHLERNPGPAHCYPIWQVARATTAAPTYFDRMVIGNHTFWDGGFGCNNPSLEAYSEVVYMNNENVGAVSLLLSIGTGESRISRFARGKWSQVYQFLRAAKKLASDSQKVHDDMLRFSENGRRFPYYRLNVREGLSEMKLDEWKKAKGGRLDTLGQLTSATQQYLHHGFVDKQRTVSVQQHLHEVAEKLVNARRLRAGTARWEAVSLGVRYRCTIEHCRSGQKLRGTSMELWRHFCQSHNMSGPADCTDDERQTVQDLIERGRVEP